MKFFIATKNSHKLTELKRILEPMGYKVASINDLTEDFPEPCEDGLTFEDNALIKARAGLKFTGLPTVADDSGLCVDALDGAPGIYSARYSGEGDEGNNKKLLSELGNLPLEKRTAHYVSAIACVFPDGREFTVRGECYGKIGFTKKGSNGFGYDPLFITETGMTFGEMSASEKDAISHRANSLKKFSEALKKYI